MRKSSSAHLAHELKLIASCPIMSAQTLLRGRWKIPVLWNLRSRPHSFAELQRIFPIASERMLTLHLRELLRDGFIVREEPVGRRIAYRLSGLGRSLLPTLESLRLWGEEAGVISLASRSLNGAAAEDRS